MESQVSKSAKPGAPSIFRGHQALALAFQGAVERLVEGGFGFFVILRGNFALLALDFQLEEFFFQRFEDHGGF